jgi:hypothetical protein
VSAVGEKASWKARVIAEPGFSNLVTHIMAQN